MILSNKIVGLITGKLQCQSLGSFNLTSVSSAKSPVIHATLTLIREVPEETIVVMPGIGLLRYAQTDADNEQKGAGGHESVFRAQKV